MKSKKIFHIISNTHWDREWRFPFQRNRQMLVEMMDAVLEILQKEPKYKAFHLDSQSIVLTDYLEIRPDKKSIIKKLVKEKRLFIGPWFILPDEFLVGGENLIRNLLLGHKICAEYGGASKVGYSPFSWGQISQLPQIYSGFDIDVIMFYRGINSLESHNAEFIWEGADGTKALSSRFSFWPRYNFYFFIYRPVIHNEQPSDIEYDWLRGGTPFHFADKQLVGEDYFIINPVDNYFKENIKPSVEAIIERQANDFTTPHVIWMEGHDSSGPNINTVRIINDIKEIFPQLDVRHSTLEDYTRLLKGNADYSSLPLVKGERRSSQYDHRSGNMYAYTTSARMYLKQINFTNEKWLQYYAEPFNLFAGLNGLNTNDNYLNIAWNLLLQNSAHDSIGGCSLDEIHDDMMNRSKQSIEISKGVFERAGKYLIKNINLNSLVNNNNCNNEIFITVLNPLQYERNDVLECFIDIPEKFDKGSFDIYDSFEKKLEVQVIASEKTEPVLEQMIDRPMYFSMTRYHTYIYIKNIPPFGYKSFRVIPKRENTLSKPDNLVSVKNKLPVLENKFLKITINRNGTINLFDKKNNQQYKNILYFYDEGEEGGAWTHIPVKPFITSLSSKPEISILKKGNLHSSLLIRHELNIPVNLSERKKKNGKKIKLPINLILELNKNSRRLDINIELENKAESHRLRLMIPTKLQAEYTYGEGQFDVVARSTNRPDTSDWVEQPMYDYPMHHFVDISNSKKGVAIFTNGLKEYEYLDDKENTLAITLFRAFQYIIYPSSKQDYSYQKGSQCFGKQSFQLSIYSHKGNWNDDSVYKESLLFSYEPRLIQSGGSTGKLPPVNSFFKIDNENFVISSLKYAESNDGSVILRLYNPTDKKIDGSLESYFTIESAEYVTLEEKTLSSIKLKTKKCFMVSSDRKKICTIKLKLKK